MGSFERRNEFLARKNPVYCSRDVKGIAEIAVIARNRRNRKNKNLTADGADRKIEPNLFAVF